MQTMIPGCNLTIHTWLTVFAGEPTPIQKSSEGHVIGDYHSHGWDLCADLAQTILDAAQTALSCDYSAAAHIGKMFNIADSKIQFGVAIYSSTTAPNDFENVAMDVIRRINPKQRYTRRDADPHQKHADQFLERHGSQRIPEVLLVKTGNSQSELRGKFPQQAERSEIKPELLEVAGKADGIIRSRRTLIIEFGKKKSRTVKFEEEKHIDQIADAVKDGKMYKFLLAVVNNGNDKPETVLREFDLLNDGWEF